MTSTLLPSIDPPEKIHGMALFPLREVFVKARGGKMWMREIKIGITWDNAFRKSWKDMKQAWVDRGFSLRCKDNSWVLQQWLVKTPDGWALPEPAPTIRKPAGMLIEREVTEIPELPPLPGGFEDKLLPYQRQPARQLYRAITCGLKEWGYPGALDLSDLGTGKTYQCLAAALATGRRVNVICTVSTIPSWKRAFKHFGAVPGMIHNWEGLRTGGTYHAPAITELSSTKRSGPVANAYKWRLNPETDILLCDEAHNARTVGSLNQALAMSAIRTGVPIIAMSATMAVDPTHMRFCGRIIGLHRNKESYFRFLHDHGCTRVGGEYEWRFCGGRRGQMMLANISRKIIPMRGARVRKEDLGDAFPETQIWAEPIACEDTDKIGAHWRKVQQMTEALLAKGMSEQSAERILEKEYREGWQMSEMAKVPALAELIREKIAEGFSVPVFMSFTASREKLLAALGSTCTIHGGQQGVSGRAQRQAAIDAFQEDREHAIIVQIAAGGTGVDMHDVRGERPRHAIHLPNPRADHVIQALGRVQRAGGKSVSTQVVLWAEGTMEEQIVENIRRKAMQINALNNGDSKAQAHF
jgi:hypothetical protein